MIYNILLYYIYKVSNEMRSPKWELEKQPKAEMKITC